MSTAVQEEDKSFDVFASLSKQMTEGNSTDTLALVAKQMLDRAQQLEEESKAAALKAKMYRGFAHLVAKPDPLRVAHQLGQQMGLLDCSYEEYAAGNAQAHIPALTEEQGLVFLEKLISESNNATLP